MFKKTVSVVLLFLLVISTFTLAFKIQPVKADGGTIYIRADGGIDPQTAPISTVDNITYTLTGNVSSDGDGIIVQRDNITLDVAGYLIRGVANGTGVDLTGRSNVTLMNGNIQDFGDAVYLSNSQGNVIMENNIDNVHGLLFWNSNNNTVSNNNVTSSSTQLAFYFSSSSCNTIIANNVTNSSQAFRFEQGSSNNTVYGNTLSGGATLGIQFIGGNNNAAIENSVTSYQDGIELSNGAQNSLVSRNTVSGCGERGIDLWSFGVINNSIVGNNVTNCWYGIRCSGYGNTLFGNELEDNGIGIGLELSSSGNIASKNSILSNYYGIEFYQNNNSVCNGNDITNSHYEGISVFQSYNNSIFHNSIVNNTEQVHHGSSIYPNIWDDGYPSGGNYWSDYNGTDLYSGSYQNVTGSDGIGDTAYLIDASNTDHYPLMNQWPTFCDIAITNVISYKTLVGQGYCTNITAILTNLGNYTESFNITVYVNTTSIETQELTPFASGDSAQLVFTWNTTGFACGIYSVSAYAWPVPDETNMTNNSFTDGWVAVPGPGDLTGGTSNALDFVPDGKVDMKDVGVVARFFNQNVSPAPSNCDITGPTPGVPDGKVDMRDIGLVARHFGDHYTYP